MFIKKKSNGCACGVAAAADENSVCYDEIAACCIQYLICRTCDVTYLPVVLKKESNCSRVRSLHKLLMTKSVQKIYSSILHRSVENLQSMLLCLKRGNMYKHK